MTHIDLKNVSLRYRIYGTSTRSLKRSLLQFASGGRLKKDDTDSIMSVDALSQVTFRLEKGDKLGLIGPNGAGKSTLLKVMAGFYVPTSGSIESKGHISPLLNLGVGMQQNSTGYENIKIRCLMHGYSRKKTEAIIADIEEFTELGDFLSMPVKVYSSGMNVRLSFGLATAIDPDILLLDEVVGAGDASFIQKAQKRLDNLVGKCSVLVFASHSNELIKKMCNKAIWLEKGEIKFMGGAEEVIRRYQMGI